MIKSTYKIFINICLLSLLCGCSFLSRQVRLAPVVKGDIINADDLEKGGVVEVVPFSAGFNAVAGEELDKAALVIIRGIEQELTSDGAKFQMSYQKGVDQRSDLIMVGRIDRFETYDGWKRYLGGARKRMIKVSGKVLDSSGNIVADFEHQLSKKYGDMSHNDFLLKVGRDIGQFLKGEGVKR